jgi:hypothetical protein
MGEAAATIGNGMPRVLAGLRRKEECDSCAHGEANGDSCRECGPLIAPARSARPLRVGRPRTEVDVLEAAGCGRLQLGGAFSAR